MTMLLAAGKLFVRSVAVVAALSALAGCGAGVLKPANLPPASDGPAYRASHTSRPASDGAIYQEGRALAFFEDPRARRIGDIITIHLTESFNASKTASTQTQKDNTTEIAAPVAGVKTLGNFAATADAKRAFKGQGTSSQQNALTGSITAVITEVLPNGNLVISGERALQLNQGEEFVRVRGVVRAIDVQYDNTVTSDRIADARISYSGRGVVDASNRQGWLARFFNSPIAPY